MHIPDGVLSPTVCAGTTVIGVGAVGYALTRVRRALPERAVPLMGVTAACLFAAQMLNFPVPGGTSGHLLGGLLAAVLLGPWGGLLVMAIVILVQCVLFQDGGITAWGANTLNMGVTGSVVGYAIYDSIRRRIGGFPGVIAGGTIAAWITVILGATLCSLELAGGGRYLLGPTLGAMLVVHTLVGVGEALLTGLTLAFVLQTRPDLIYSSHPGRLARTGQVMVGGLALALLMAVLLSPFASTLPEGLERAMQSQDQAAQPATATMAQQEAASEHSATAVIPAPFPDYKVPGISVVQIAGSIAGGLGTLIVFALTWFLARQLPRGRAPEHLAHAR